MEWILGATCFILLFMPLLWELGNDAAGDHNKAQDVFIRSIIGIVAAVAGYYICGKNIFASFFLSMAIHIMFFDYLIAYTLIKNGAIETKVSWFRYSGKSSIVDNVAWWKRLNPWLKLTVRILVLVGALIIYFK